MIMIMDKQTFRLSLFQVFKLSSFLFDYDETNELFTENGRFQLNELVVHGVRIP